MDSRTIVYVQPDTEQPGHFLVILSDGTTAKVADFVDSPEGVRAELRAPDGSLIGEGPLLTEETRAAFEAFGVVGIPTHTPLVHVEAVATPAAAPSIVANYVHASYLEQIAAKIRAGEIVLVSAIANALHEL